MLSHAGNWLRTKARNWLRIVDRQAEPLPIEKEAEKRGISIHAETLRRAGEKHIVARKFEPPKLPPGVIPTDTQYAASEDPGGLGQYLAADSELVAPTYAYANQFNCGLGFPGYAYLAELSQRSEYRAPSETIASEMTREWIKIIAKGSKAQKTDDDEETSTQADDLLPDLAKQSETDEEEGDDEPLASNATNDKIEKLTEALERFKVRDAFRKCAELDGFFGRAQLFIDIDVKGRDSLEVRQMPLCVDSATIPKGSLKAFTVVEPIWTTPFNYNATDPTACDFYKPRAWYILGKRTHATRLLTFISREVADILKPAYNFGGLSMTQLMESSVFKWLRASNSVSDLIHNFSVMCLKTDMTNILAGNADKQGGLLDRAALFTQTRDNQGLTLLDMEREDLAAVNVPLSGLHELQAQAQEHMAAPSHIPLVKLLGISPAGLNASSEGEIKVFYDFVRACQQRLFAEHLDTVLKILQLNEFGVIDDAIGFEFVTLTSPTIKELSEIRKVDADTAGVYIDKGVVSPDEVRQRIATDPESGYNNLAGSAPPPPAMGEMEAEHELGEAAAGAAHERGEESAEAAHKRDMKIAKAAPKTK